MPYPAPQDRIQFRPASEYRLLPFRFGRLRDATYIVTNDVGEYEVLTKDQLHAFAGRRLDVDGSLYRRLKAKHFLFDDTSRVALDLLGLKYRTRLEPLSWFTGLHMFVVTLRCTNSCRYCQVTHRSEDSPECDMSFPTADRALEFAFRSPSPRIKVEFQGGEPLLNFPVVRHVVERASELARSAGKDVAYVIASNLALLSDDVIAFCRDRGVSFSTSLDGPRDLHDCQRPLRGGPSYAKTVEGIRRLQRELGSDSVSALMTATRASLSRADDIIDEYVRLGLHSVFLRSMRPYGFALHNHMTETCPATDWVAFYARALDQVLAANKRGFPMREEFTSILLQKIFSPMGTRFVDLQSPAGLGIAAVAFNHEGTVYASDEGRMLAEMGLPAFRLGHLTSDSFDAMMTCESLVGTLSDTMLEGVPQCSDCPFLPYCGAEPVYHLATQGDIVGHKARSDFCRKQSGVLRHLINLLESDSSAREILLSWV